VLAVHGGGVCVDGVGDHFRVGGEAEESRGKVVD
jgi:hypothetical protein